MEELELYKLITESDYVESFGWREMGIGHIELLVWVRYIWLDDFVEKIKEIFGTGMFEDGGVSAVMLDDCICINLEDLVESYLDVKDVFPIDKYQS